MRWLVGRRLVSSSSYRDHMMMIFCWCEWVRSEYRLLESRIYDMGTKPSSAREQRARFPLVDSGLRSPIRHKSARFIHLLLLLLTYLLAGLPGWLTEHWIRTRTSAASASANAAGGGGASAHFEFFFLCEQLRLLIVIGLKRDMARSTFNNNLTPKEHLTLLKLTNCCQNYNHPREYFYT